MTLMIANREHESMSWLNEGLEELGLSMVEYKRLRGKARQEIDRYLKEMGHL